MLRQRSAKAWSEVSCVVQQITVKVHSGDDDTYSPEVTFDYLDRLYFKLSEAEGTIDDNSFFKSSEFKAEHSNSIVERDQYAR